MKTTVYVLCGGRTVEHDVSLISATGIINSLSRENYTVIPIYINQAGCFFSHGPVFEKIENPQDLKIRWEGEDEKDETGKILQIMLAQTGPKVVFPALHGTFGEDGTVQGLLDMLNIAYVGNGVMSSAIAMDKGVTKDLFHLHGIPQSRYQVFTKSDWQNRQLSVITNISKAFDYPLFVKPARGGSSVGISQANDLKAFQQAVDKALEFDDKIVVEETLVGREMQISVVGNQQPEASVVGEFIQERAFMDYAAKYLDGKLIQVIPANLTGKTAQAMRKTAVDAFQVLNCQGLARVDFFVCQGERFYVNEVNTMPGFTMKSMTPVLWERTDGTTYSQLVDRLIQLAIERHEERNKLCYERGDQ